MTMKFYIATALASVALATTTVFADTPPLTDGQITQIILTADQAQIDAGLAAHDQAQNSTVKDYADNSILAYTANLTELKKLEITTGIKPEDSDASKALKEETDKQLQDIKAQKGVSFDKAYIDNQVEMQQRYLESLDMSLIPQAKNADIQSFLKTSRSSLESQLNSAKAIQAALNPPAPKP